MLYIKKVNSIKGYSLPVIEMAIGMRKAFYLLIILGAAITACKKPFVPAIISSNLNYLVVEGVINNGVDSTFITLNRTVKLSDKATGKPEIKAVVTVEDDQNNIIALKEAGKGSYVAGPLTLNNSRTYRMRIKTTDGLVYLSDFVPVKNAPPIDSIAYKVTGRGVSITTNSHDPNNNTRYYRWGFEETWRFHAYYISPWVTNGTAIVVRSPAQSVYYCFDNDTSNSILLGSTAKLSNDVVYQAPITIIDSLSEKVEVRYSMLLKQYALTKEAYEFWSNIKKNTETLGSIFDAQPSAAIGNIHCVSNPAQPVIGYISVGTVTTKRIFIDKSELPNWGATDLYCLAPEQQEVFHASPPYPVDDIAKYLIPLTSTKIIIEQYLESPPYGAINYYVTTSRLCGDCSVRGKLAPPPFWK